ncbi:MAG TPA: phosphoribosyl-AMP cyclohydrolase [Marinagarivorans sp.]
MTNSFYQSLESITVEQSIPLRDCIAQLTFDAQGLIPVIAQCQQTGQVLMHAWMNLPAIEKTLVTRRMTYWSRSRNTFWVKGETSGHTQKLIVMRFDCDGDTLLCLVDQQGPACHTGRPSCFYLQADCAHNAVKLNAPYPPSFTGSI